ncbi:MAG: hypothetical protein RIF41_34105 [Polyangiaceae bacterium]
MTATATTSDAEKLKKGSRVRTIAAVKRLEDLVTAHPDALREIYASGAPADPTTFNGFLHGRLLTVESFSLPEIYMLARPVVRLTSRLLPWRGKRFESGGTGGADVVLGREAMRFRCELGDSLVDGQPTLVMAYEGLGNPWPFAHGFDELRKVGETVAMGPGFFRSRGGVDLWYGLELPRL